MTYTLATEDEIQFAQKRRDPFPWAAGQPGTLFDKQGDILWCNGGPDTAVFKEWANKNNIPLCWSASYKSSVKIQGWVLLTFQHGVRLTFQKDDSTFTEVNRALGIIMPEMLPIVIRVAPLVRKKNEKDTWIKGLHFNLFEPGLSEYASFNIFYSGDTWLLIRSRYCASSVVFEDTDREAFFTKVRERFGWSDHEDADFFDDDSDDDSDDDCDYDY